MKVLHAPVNVGNQPWVLSRHERALGIQSDVVVNYNTLFSYRTDRVLGTYGKSNWREVFRRAPFGFLAPFQYDVLHYYFGRSLLFWDDLGRWNRLPFVDVKLAKTLGKKVYMTLQGCDVRLAGESNRRNVYTPCAEGHCAAFKTCVAGLDEQRRNMIRKVLPMFDRVFFLNPELGHFVPNGAFLPYASAEVEEAKVFPLDLKRTPRIVHAPTDGNIKGTRLITDALNALRSDIEFEFVLVQNLAHHEAMDLYRSADIAIDQVLAGWYGGFAVEMMAMGKPVMCWIREEDLAFVPSALRANMPILNVHPERLAKDIGRILRMRELWPEWGHASRNFVLKWHNPSRIAALMVEMYADPSNSFDLASISSSKQNGSVKAQA